MNKKSATSLLAVLVVLVMVTTVVAYSETGVPNSNRGADCGRCHRADSSLTIAMQASSSSLDTGQQVSVWVNVTRNGAGGEGDEEEIGPLAVVLLAGTATGNGTDPVSGGWTIVSDPAGTLFNENQQNAGAGPTPYHWTLRAPTAAGTYKLLAQAFHDGPSFTTYSLGLTFDVSAGPVPLSTRISSPESGATIYGAFMIMAEVTGSQLASASLTMDGDPYGGALTSAPFQWTADASGLSVGPHTLVLTAIDSNGSASTDQVTFVVAHSTTGAGGSASSTPMSPGLFAVVAVIVIALAMVVSRLMVRDKR